jgi:excisionase family DNA binding protein
MAAWLTASQAAKILNISPKTLNCYAKDGRIPFQCTLGGHRRYDRAVIEALAESLRQDATTDWRQP